MSNASWRIAHCTSLGSASIPTSVPAPLAEQRPSQLPSLQPLSFSRRDSWALCGVQRTFAFADACHLHCVRRMLSAIAALRMQFHAKPSRMQQRRQTSKQTTWDPLETQTPARNLMKILRLSYTKRFCRVLLAQERPLHIKAAARAGRHIFWQRQGAKWSRSWASRSRNAEKGHTLTCWAPFPNQQAVYKER
jgi:hypothetical protein